MGDWGSYVSLRAYSTDIPYEGPVQAQLRMEACESCGLCRAACPFGAIGDTEVIDATRCPALWNEHPGPVPRRVRDVYHTFFGCVRCQECFPMNPAVDYDSNVLELDEDETQRLLSRTKRLSGGLKEKFQALGCEKWMMPALKRNARLFVKARET